MKMFFKYFIHSPFGSTFPAVKQYMSLCFVCWLKKKSMNGMYSMMSDVTNWTCSPKLNYGKGVALKVHENGYSYNTVDCVLEKPSDNRIYKKCEIQNCPLAQFRQNDFKSAVDAYVNVLRQKQNYWTKKVERLKTQGK